MKLNSFFLLGVGLFVSAFTNSRAASDVDLCEERFTTTGLNFSFLNLPARSEFNQRLADLNLSLVPLPNVEISTVVDFMDRVRRQENMDVPAMKARGVDRDLETAAQNYDGPGSEFFCVKKGNDIVATAALLKVADHTFEIRKFYVGANLRGQGVGRQMLKMLIEKARTNHARRINLQTHNSLTGAIKLYESEGFVADPHTPPKGADMTPFTLALPAEAN